MSGQSPRDSRSQILSLIRLDDTHQRPGHRAQSPTVSQYLDFLRFIPFCMSWLVYVWRILETFIPECKLTFMWHFNTLLCRFHGSWVSTKVTLYQETVTRWLVISGCEQVKLFLVLLCFVWPWLDFLLVISRVVPSGQVATGVLMSCPSYVTVTCKPVRRGETVSDWESDNKWVIIQIWWSGTVLGRIVKLDWILNVTLHANSKS